MRIYRVPHRGDGGEHTKYSYHTSKKEAKKAWNETDPDDRAYYIMDEIEAVEFNPTKRGILGLLTFWASHPDNG